MNRTCRAALWTSAFACGFAWGDRAARADEPMAQATLAYSRGAGTESCPDEGALRQLVALRLGYDPFVAQADKHVGVVMAKEASGFTAHITTRVRDGDPRERDIAAEGGSCEELAASVVLAVSLAVDPRSFGGPRKAAPAVPPPPPPPQPIPAPAPAPPSPTVAVPPSSPPRRPWTVDLSGGARVGFGIVPSVSLGPVLEARIGPHALALLVDAGADLPTGSATNAQVSPGSVVASLLWGGVGLCTTPLFLFVCGRVDAGAIEGSGRGLSERHTATSVYAGFALAGGAVREITHGLTVSLRAEVLAPVTRTSLTLEGATVWTEPTIAGTLGLSAGYRF